MLATAPDSVPYYYGLITRENAELILWDRGCLDGMYLLRASHNRDAAFVLSVCQAKQVLHYRIIKDSNGMYHMHGLPVDKHVGPIEVLEQVQGMPCKLLIPCLKPLNVFMPGVNCGMTDDKLKEALQKKATEWGIQESELNLMLEDKENDVWKLILKTLHESEAWFHGKISREEAEKRLGKGEYKDGKFLIRERDDRSFTLSLCHSERVKHYKIDVLPSSEVGIQDGPRFENLISLVSHYSVFSDGLWCILQYPCVNLTLDLPHGGGSSTTTTTAAPSSPTATCPAERRNSNSDLIDGAMVAPATTTTTTTTVPDLISDCSLPPGQPAFPLNRPIFSPIAENRNGSMNFHRQPHTPADTSFRKFMLSKLRPPTNKSSSPQNTVKLKPVPLPKTTAVSPAPAISNYSFKGNSNGTVPVSQPSSVFYKQLPAGIVSMAGDHDLPTATPSLPPPTEPPPSIPTKNRPLRTPPAVPVKVSAGVPIRKLTPIPQPPLSVVGMTVSGRKLAPPPPPPLSSISSYHRKLTAPPPPPLSLSGSDASVRQLSPPPVPVKSPGASHPIIMEEDGNHSDSEPLRSSVDLVPPAPSVTEVVSTEDTISAEEDTSSLAPPVAETVESDPAVEQGSAPDVAPVVRAKPQPRPRRNLPVFQKVRNSEHLENSTVESPTRVSPSLSDRHSSPAAVELPSTPSLAQPSVDDHDYPFHFSSDVSPPVQCQASTEEVVVNPPLTVGSSDVVQVRPAGVQLAWMTSTPTPVMTNLLAELKGHRIMGIAELVPDTEMVDLPAGAAEVTDDVETDRSPDSTDGVSKPPEIHPVVRLKSTCESSEEGGPSRNSTVEPQYEEIDPDYASHKDNESAEIVTGLADPKEDEEENMDESQQESLVNEFVEECKWDYTHEDVSANSNTATRSFQRKPPWTKEESELHFNTIKRHRTGPMAINRQHLQFQEKLGLGNFGDVVKATFNSGTDQVPCAVKMLRKNNMASGKESIMREARIMTKFDHPHIVRLLGVSEGEPFYLVMELAPLGPLSLYLRRNPAFPFDDILVLLKQVCQGMQYLESKQFVHRDLAARNVLLVNYSFIKISDFGMSKALGLHSDYYTVEPQGKLPLKWYAPECIYFFKFSTKSDVWSFGITLWEAMSYGVTPYQGMTGREILKMFATNSRLTCPNRCPPEVFAIMKKCWEFRPEDRPSFSELLPMFTKLVEK